MALFRNFPYTNFHDLNLNWIIRKLKEFDTKIKGVVTSVNGAHGDVIIPIPDAFNGSPAALGASAPGVSQTYARGDHVHEKPTYTASDVGAAPAVTEVTVSSTGAVTQALDAGKIYHFTGALTSLTITLNAAGAGIIPQYHFDFDSGSTAPTVTLPGTVTMQGGTFTPEESKHYEMDILNGYGVYAAW